jgi:hypothetical protein
MIIYDHVGTTLIRCKCKSELIYERPINYSVNNDKSLLSNEIFPCTQFLTLETLQNSNVSKSLQTGSFITSTVITINVLVFLKYLLMYILKSLVSTGVFDFTTRSSICKGSRIERVHNGVDYALAHGNIHECWQNVQVIQNDASSTQ